MSLLIFLLLEILHIHESRENSIMNPMYPLLQLFFIANFVLSLPPYFLLLH